MTLINAILKFFGLKPFFRCDTCSKWEREGGVVNHLDIETQRGIMRLRVCSECADELEEKSLRE